MQTRGAKVPGFIKRWVDSFLSAIRTALIRGATGEKAKLWAIKNLKPEDLARLAVVGLKANSTLMGWSSLPETASEVPKCGEWKFPPSKRGDRNEAYDDWY